MGGRINNKLWVDFKVEIFVVKDLFDRVSDDACQVVFCDELNVRLLECGDKVVATEDGELACSSSRLQFIVHEHCDQRKCAVTLVKNVHRNIRKTIVFCGIQEVADMLHDTVTTQQTNKASPGATSTHAEGMRKGEGHGEEEKRARAEVKRG